MANGDESHRLKVLVVALGRRGGVNKYGCLMSEALARSCDVAAITSANAENAQTWRELGLPQLEVATFTGLAGLLLSFVSPTRFRQIGRFARRFDPDVIYYPGVHAWKPLLDLVLPRSAATVLTVHDPSLHAGEDSLAYRVLAAANRYKIDGYVLLNKAQLPTFVERYHLNPDRVRVIPHGIFDSVLVDRKPLYAIKELADLQPITGRFVLFIGRIRQYKGVETLLRAYGAVPEHVRLPLVIAGSGRFSAEARKLLDSANPRQIRVENRWLSDLELASLVGAARFVVLPYTTATQSGVIPLASAFGIPAIASDAGGLSEQLVDGETGILFRAGDSDALARALIRSFSMRDSEYAEMSSRCREHACKNWGWAKLAEQLVEFLEALRPRAETDGKSRRSRHNKLQGL